MTPERYIIETMFRIPNKEGQDVDFKLNDVQASLDENRETRNIIPKARQRGISTYISALFLARCLSTRNRRCVVVSHTVPATTKLLDKVHYMLDHLKGDVKAELRFSSRNELYFSRTDSTFYMGTAGNANVGVGDTITDLHCSEPALWTDPMPLLKGLFNAVPQSGTIFIEGTGAGMGNWYHKQCMRAADGSGLYKLHFFSWTDAPEYRTKVPRPDMFMETLDEEERQFFDNKVLDLEQLRWRRLKIEEMDYDLRKFREQFPLSLEECFQGAGSSIFNKVNYQITAAWKKSNQFSHFWQLENHPYPSQHYVAGVDVASGAGLDNTVLEIFSLDEMRQVGEWVCNTLEPDRAAEAHLPILRRFNNPYINAERNNYGILYIKELLKIYEHYQFHLSKRPKGAMDEYGRIADYGTFTSGRSRPEILGSFRKAVAKEVTIHSPLLKAEMDSFIENENGRMEPQEGCLDDRIFAASHATYVLPKAAARVGLDRDYNKERPSPFQLEGILSELEERYQSAESPL